MLKPSEGAPSSLSRAAVLERYDTMKESARRWKVGSEKEERTPFPGLPEVAIWRQSGDFKTPSGV